MIVSEIFRSLQGEGKNQGRPCTFIRLAGCNLRCAWCDTPYAREGGKEMSVAQILDLIWLQNGKHICITGGEPLLWAEEVLELLRKFDIHGYNVEIETNGTLDFREMQAYASICMDVKCPSSGEKSNLALLRHITPRDSVKFVVADENDLLYARAVMAHYEIRGEVFISPVEGADYRAIAEYIVEEDLPVRFQVQLHKILGVK
ncbi:radical SAM protein [Methanoculleus bourgensis]|jgi:7-carboxy-7-deazaguanine synthase|uniref:7-carboxy-7-deazaguanine synthase n=1 Tax=Methanoculleus bourgensis TaxID=83986 RepID=A0A0X3BLT1_9EURY|nr:radical SAM protein [Methanoculleus bourgensis]MBT0732826.1 radical SAM protein [Methanoculleus bourgensis]MDD3372302.1 radical SAM protein [Methanoculleus bourgensis]NMA89552.1 radical SAM protein [Methanoculleus bourgensis]NQS77780.1 radical SAM protein [Methanoculleus bourgensis]CVK33072.1 7-carboxy-7-deazaguanine synthase [Methanoculleus bourgensis]